MLLAKRKTLLAKLAMSKEPGLSRIISSFFASKCCFISLRYRGSVKRKFINSFCLFSRASAVPAEMFRHYGQNILSKIILIKFNLILIQETTKLEKACKSKSESFLWEGSTTTNSLKLLCCGNFEGVRKRFVFLIRTNPDLIGSG